MDDQNKKYKSALKVNDGVNQPPSTNENAIARFKKIKRKKLSVNDYVDGILKGDRIVLSRAITLIESSLSEHRKTAHEIIEKCLPYSGNSYRIGITGVPGVGKSTFIEAIGEMITKKERKLAVLAIDPSSERSKGSILGDKTRMEKLSVNEKAFIRPSPSAGSLGGVAAKTRESIILCEAAGFNTIFVETVGVGQSETVVHSMVDFFLLLMLSGAGDELQGIKRGIMEMADAIAITKADDTNIQQAKNARAEYKKALHLFPPTESGWVPQVTTCSAVSNEGIENVWNIITYYFSKHNDYIATQRKQQAKHWMYETINDNLQNHFYQKKDMKAKIEEFEQSVSNGNISSYLAAKILLKDYFGDSFSF